MLPAPAQLYKCPHCGKTKPMLSLTSGNTFGGELWSDGRAIYPMHPSISAIQKCPNCGKYSFFDNWENTGRTDSDTLGGTTGNLSYQEAKEAYKTLLSNSSNNQRSYDIALFFVRAYNNEFRRPQLREAFYKETSAAAVSGRFPNPTEDDVILFREASQLTIDYSNNTRDALIIKAEMHRERGEWEEALEILHGLQIGHNQWIVDTIIYFARQRKSFLIPFMIDGREIKYWDQPNFRTLLKPEDFGIKEERKKNLDEYLSYVTCVTKKDLGYDVLGGVYDERTKTLLKLVGPSPEYYDVEDETRNIDSFAFYRNERIKRVRGSSQLSTIGIKAFYGCKNLESVEIQGSNLQFIGDCAFMNCKSLRVINFIDNVRYIGRSAFAGMDELGLVRLPEGIEEIPEFSFFECSYLEIINIPNSVRHIASYSFQHTAITILEIPDSVATLGDAVFSRCFKLRTVKLPAHLVTIPERTFDSCESLRNIEIPKTVESIEKEAFSDTIALERIRFHGKVKYISETAFKGSGLKEIIVPFWTKGHYKKLFPNLTIRTTIL